MARFRLVLDVKGFPGPQLVVIDVLILVDPLEDFFPKGVGIFGAERHKNQRRSVWVRRSLTPLCKHVQFLFQVCLEVFETAGDDVRGCEKFPVRALDLREIDVRTAIPKPNDRKRGG